jgi:hypothetical protein
MIDLYARMINNVEANRPKINYWFTKYESNGSNFVEVMKNIIENLETNELHNLNLKPFLVDIKNKAEEKK